MSINYRTLLRTALAGDDEATVLDDMLATRILATRIPDLCPDCDQGDVKHLPYSQTCLHPNAPTIADLLRWGENVAKASAHNPWENAMVAAAYRNALAALRTEADR